ncbi:MAG: LanC-like protein [Actinobacteria bacterium]|nr:LanC-like protein [Actinomycetota bacterium]
MYVGAAGVVWALDRLRERAHAETKLDLAAVAHRALEAWRERPGVLTTLSRPEPWNPALFMGESGILLVLWRLEPHDELADDLVALVRENLPNPANDVMWGTPGTLLAARAMHEWTGEERWAEAVQESEGAVLAARDADGLWTIRELEGDPYRGLGPFHGAVGNALALGAEDLGAQLRRTAVAQDGLANWPAAESETKLRLQWCFGAPGIVTCAASYLDEELLLAGAELAWRAGPPGPEKGPSLCHGTAGNGWALLKAFERTQDERWLERARRFAVHALEHSARLPPRYSLWTGDLGVALFAADCLDARTRYPVLESWD